MVTIHIEHGDQTRSKDLLDSPKLGLRRAIVRTIHL